FDGYLVRLRLIHLSISLLETSKAPAVARRTPLHPPTMVMVNEALKELDSRKGVSSQAIRGYITEKYPPVRVIGEDINSKANGAQGRLRVKAEKKKQKEKPSEDAKASASKVAPAKKHKSKRAEGTAEDQPKAQKTTKGEGAAKKGAKAKAFQKPMKGDTAAPEVKPTGK
ncbi:histone H1-like, partial [Salvelinus alpinus]|uniref:histone H1-like n=1 Tax=Salvelinus alpinus TaxID=8036 RepID=UPI0039FD7DC3